MITELTQWQQDQMAIYRDKWIAIERCTDPANRTEAEKGIHLSYKLAGLEPPKHIIWTSSPLATFLYRDGNASVISSFIDIIADVVRDKVRSRVRGNVVAYVGNNVLGNVWDNVWDNVRGNIRDNAWFSVKNNPESLLRKSSRWESIRGNVWDRVRGNVGISVGISVVDSVVDSRGAFISQEAWTGVRNSVGGQHDAGWLSFYHFFGEVCNLDISRIEGLIQVAQNAGWWLPFNNYCFVSERHSELHFDDANRLHNETGASIKYSDDWLIYHWHGIRVPEKIIMQPIEFDSIMQEQNAEIKRVMIERFGEDQFIKALAVDPIDKSEWGMLYRVDYGDTEPLMLVRVVDPSTQRIYFNQVPPIDNNGDNMITAKQAVAWRFGMTEDEYMPLEQA